MDEVLVMEDAIYDEFCKKRRTKLKKRGNIYREVEQTLSAEQLYKVVALDDDWCDDL